jgi:hypothetical protein
VAQEVFIRAFRNLNKLHKPAQFARWIRGTSILNIRSHTPRPDARLGSKSVFWAAGSSPMRASARSTQR